MCDNLMITGPVSVSCLRMRLVEKARNLYAFRTVWVKLSSRTSPCWLWTSDSGMSQRPLMDLNVLVPQKAYMVFGTLHGPSSSLIPLCEILTRTFLFPIYDI